MGREVTQSDTEQPTAGTPEAGAVATDQPADGRAVESAKDTTAEAAPGPAARTYVADVPAAELANPPRTPDEDKTDAGEEADESIVEGALTAYENGTLPDNKWSRTLNAYNKEAKRLGLEGGPLTNGIKMIFALMAMYSHIGDLVPGGYVARLDNDDNLKNQKLSEEDLEKILAAKKPDELPAPTDAETLKKKGLGPASTVHACSALWGISGIEDPDVLSAKLRHADKKVGDENVSYYRSATFAELTAQGMPYGTVLVFTPDISKADKVVAYATGNGNECQYFDATTGSVKTFSLADENSPISSFNLLTAFVPKFDSDPDWFKDNTEQLDARVSDAPASQASPGPAEAGAQVQSETPAPA